MPGGEAGLRGSPLSLVMLNLFGNYPFSTGNRSPAKAGVHAGQRCAIWTPAFAGEQLLTCLKDSMIWPRDKHCVNRKGGPWMLKQVQRDGWGNDDGFH